MIVRFFICYALWTTNPVSGHARLPIASFLRTEEVEDGVANVLNFIQEEYMKTASSPLLTVYWDVLTEPPGDVYGVWDKVCNRLSSTGAFCVLGTGDALSFSAYDSLCAAHQVPFVNWGLSSWLLEENAVSKGSEYTVNLKPPVDELLADIIHKKKWSYVTYMHDGIDSALTMQSAFTRLKARLNPHQTYVELLPLPDNVLEYADFLREFHRERFNTTTQHGGGFYVIVDVSNSAKLTVFLNALFTNSLQSPDRFHYLLTDFGLTPRDMSRIKRGFLNMTVLQLVDRDTRFFKDISKKFSRFLADRSLPDDSDLPADLALAFDAVLVAQRALAQVMERSRIGFRFFDNYLKNGVVWNRDHHGILCRVGKDSDKPARNPFYETFALGHDVAQHIRKVKFEKDEALTGLIQFDERGLRRGFTVEITDYSFEEQSAAAFTDRCTWQQGIGFIEYPQPKPQDFAVTWNLTGDPSMRIITTVKTAPHIMPIGEDDDPNPQFEGFCIDMLKLIAKRIGFSYRVKLVDDGKYGGVRPDGSWNGMVGELLDGRAHIAVAPLTISRQRERVVDFSKPFMVTGITIMIKKPDKAEFSVFAFMHPLSEQIWTFICLAYLGVSIVIFLVSRFSPYEWRLEETANGGYSVSNDFSVYNCLWFTLAALMHQGTDILPRSVSGRIASSAWWFFTMILMASYTANLAAFLTSEKLEASIDSVDKLAAQTKIKYGIAGGGSTAAFFQHSTVATYQKMWQFMNSEVPSVFVDSYKEGIQRVRESKGAYAFLLEGTANEYANTRKPCDTMKVGDPLNSVGYGVATPFGSDLKMPINLAILELQEKGELKKLEIKWWYDRGQCEQGLSKASQSVSLNLSKVAGIFYILIAGMIAAMIAALGELFYRGRFDNERDHMADKLMNLTGMITAVMNMDASSMYADGAYPQADASTTSFTHEDMTSECTAASHLDLPKVRLLESASQDSMPGQSEYNTAV